jgi:hypothetical protein
MEKSQEINSDTTSTAIANLKEHAAAQARENWLRREKKLLRDLKFAKASSTHLENENRELTSRLALLQRIDSIVVEPPRWALAAKKGALHAGVPTLMLSDCHWDEIVNPEEVEGSNKYNRKIAIMRLKRVLSGTIDLLRNYVAGLKYEGFTLLLGGDHFSGNIHEELQQTNEDTIFGSLDFWSDQLASFVGALVEEFGHLHIACVVGNHGRNTRKPRAKLRVRDNLDWLLFRIVAKALAKDERITFQIPESADVNVKIYNTNYRLTHGDQFRGGSGIAGMLSPLMLGAHRKGQRQMTLNKPFDWMVIGHFHQYWTGKGIIANGSTKGYDEYAYLGNFAWERAQQAMFVTTPENGLTFSAPVFCDNREQEGW